MKKIIIVGFGDRGSIYASYALTHPNEMQVVGVVEPNKVRSETAKKLYNLTSEQCFSSFDAFIAKGKIADCVINATVDQLHYKTAIPLLENGYDMLLEKPITANKDELMSIASTAKKHGCKLVICHVLRYTPFYSSVKQIIDSGEIGEVVSIEATEHVSYGHYATSYVRGKWHSEKECGSSFLLAKSCHDLDLLCWLNSSKPQKISSYGARTYFIEASSPKGATEKCADCPYENSCPYSATTMYMKNNTMPFLTWANMEVDYDKVSDMQKTEHLKNTIYGSCVYKIGGDIVDNQTVLINYQNGSNAVFNLVGGAAKAARRLHILGTKGEIDGILDENKFTVRTLNIPVSYYDERIIDVSQMVSSGHSGGDTAIMRDLLLYLESGETTSSLTLIDDSILGHLCVYAADKSRKSNGESVNIATLSRS